MKDLREFWSSDLFIFDSNHDGVPDNTRFVINGLSESCRPIGLIDMTARLGLETSGLTMPEFNRDHIKDGWKFSLQIANTDHVHCQLLYLEKTVKVLAGTESALSDFLRWFAQSWPHGFKDHYTIGAIISIEYAVDRIRVMDHSGFLSNWQRVTIDEPKASQSFNPTFQGITDLWSTAGFYQAGRVDLNSQCDVGFVFQEPPTQMILEKACFLSARIGLHSTGLTFPLTATNRSAEIMFHVKAEKSHKEAAVRWQITEPMNTVEILIEGHDKAVANALSYLAMAKCYEEGGTFGSWEQQKRATKDEQEPLIFKKKWEDIGEKESLLTTCDDWIADIKADSHIEVTAFISEPPDIREMIRVMIHRMLVSAKSAYVHVHSAYKPGYHWVEEVVLPILRGITSEIGYVTFRCKKEAGEQGAELPIRWIQELYPVDQLLGQELGMGADQVTFDLIDGQEQTYHLIVTSTTGATLYDKTFDVPVAKMDYINSGKKVYPTTGFLQLKVDGDVRREQVIPTDRERFWTFFMEQVLQQLPDRLPMDDDGKGRDDPLFSRMIVDVEMSEEERKLGIKEERHSSLEALHEDIYFNVLDYFHYLGEKKSGQPMTSPGSIQPFIRTYPGVMPKATVKVYGFKAVERENPRTHVLTFCPQTTEPVRCTLQIGERLLTIDEDDWVDRVKRKKLVVGGLASQATKLWLGGVSYEGREIPVIDVFSPTKAPFVSTHKLAAYKPTILIETGHHPNEVSSMPAVIGLINTLESSLLDKVNLVVIPCANQDGRALHQKLTESHPEWKHHAARYNAVGLEYAHHRFRDTIFGEAEVVPRIVHRWLPDVSIDDHGIPSHEWVQPFAGYNSPPRFPVSYWIPNALIYGIGKQLSGEAYHDHRSLLTDVVEQIARKMSQDSEVTEANQEWANAYRKYGSQWLPDTFPIEKEDSMIFYHWDTKVSPNSHELIARYPEWCSLELISEAADETVYGSALNQCVKAHQLFDLAVIETIALCQRSRQFEYKKGQLTYRRERPLKIDTEKMSLK